MPRFFFDTFDDNSLRRDADGTEFADLEAARDATMRYLPDIARDEIPHNGDRRSFVVLVRNEDGEAVYSATLAFAGVMLKQ